MSATIEAERLVKTFADRTVLDGVSFTVPAGNALAIVGAAGAGKSTLIGILATLLPPSSGRAAIGGDDVVARAADVRRRIGLVLHAASSHLELTVEENLRMFATLRGLPRTTPLVDALKPLGLLSSSRTPVRRLPDALRRRLEIARALVHQPAVLLLDEPTAGLDTAARRDTWTALQAIRAERGLTVLLVTPDLEEAGMLGGRIVGLEHGKLRQA